MIHTILVPTDFSVTAHNAAMYAVALAKQIGVKKIVLYHSFGTIQASDPFQGFDETIVTEPFKKDSEEKLIEWADKIQLLSDGIEVKSYHSSKKLSDGVDAVCEMTDTNLVVMGITGGGLLKEAAGSNSVTIARHTTIPVIIVPQETKFSPLDKALLVTDLKDVESTTPVTTISSFLKTTGSQLLVLHVNTGSEKVNETEKEKLTQLLSDCNPTYHFITGNDFTEATINFVQENNISLIIIVPKRHGFMDSFFAKSHTKALAFHSKLPLLAAHN